MYSTLRERMNKVFWKWFDAGRTQDAVTLCRAWERWWAENRIGTYRGPRERQGA